MTTTAITFESPEALSLHIQDLFHGGMKVLSLYAFNATGKTRLASTFSRSDNEDDLEVDIEPVDSMVYSAHFEDAFFWDNDAKELHFGVESSWILQLIRDEGLEGQIIDTFKRYSFSNIEPSFDFDEGVVGFLIASGDDESTENVKASRGEESLLVWSIFYTTLELASQMLEEDEDNRAESFFNNLKYVVVDDPVSSIDDTKIVSIAVDLVSLVKRLASKDVKVLILTHHALFYNVVANSLGRKRHYGLYGISKTNEGMQFNKQLNDAPFSYHLFTKNLIQKAIEDDSIERYHFNLFRAILEKTANFLGYNSWGDCLSGDSKETFIRLLHLYSHGKLSEIESREMSSNEKEAFVSTFNQFIADYKWNR